MTAPICVDNQTDTRVPLATRLRTLREGLGLSQYALARKAHLSRDVIYRIESGKQITLAPEKAQQLSVALDGLDLFARPTDPGQDTPPCLSLDLGLPPVESDTAVVPPGSTTATLQLRLHGREVNLTLTDTDDTRLMERLTSLLSLQRHTADNGE